MDVSETNLHYCVKKNMCKYTESKQVV